jgi:hypothetical protein
VVRAYASVIDALFTYPYGEALPRLHSRPTVIGVAARSLGRLEEQWRIRAQRGRCALCELPAVSLVTLVLGTSTQCVADVGAAPVHSRALVAGARGTRRPAGIHHDTAATQRWLDSLKAAERVGTHGERDIAIRSPHRPRLGQPYGIGRG